MILLDTNVISELMRPEPAQMVLDWFTKHDSADLFTSAVIAVLVILSLVLTAGVLFPSIDAHAIIGILIAGAVTCIVGAIALWIFRRIRPSLHIAPVVDRTLRASWRMPPLALLNPPKLSTEMRLGLAVLRAYLVIAMVLVIVRVVQGALSH